MIPAWASINFDFDQKKISAELLRNNVYEKSMVATTNYNDQGRSVWDPEGKMFAEEIFSKHKLIHHYKESLEGGERKLVQGSYDTFRMLNLTYRGDVENSEKDSWKGKLKDKSRSPLWIQFQDPWQWRPDLEIPYTRSVIESLPMESFLTVRCIIQRAPSIGVVHKDNGYQSNQEFYKNGYGSITLNVCDGGANLWFLNHRNNSKHKVEESRYKCWHFDDSHLHCTTEVKDLRIQIRVFGKLKVPYQSLFADIID